MILLSSLLIGILFAAGLFLILKRDFVSILFGFSLLTHACNVFLISLERTPAGLSSPLIESNLPQNLEYYVDPLPQALILTAIVIGFGVTAYLVVLFFRLFRDENSTNIQSIFDQDIETYHQERLLQSEAQE